MVQPNCLQSNVLSNKLYFVCSIHFLPGFNVEATRNACWNFVNGNYILHTKMCEMHWL